MRDFCERVIRRKPVAQMEMRHVTNRERKTLVPIFRQKEMGLTDYVVCCFLRLN